MSDGGIKVNADSTGLVLIGFILGAFVFWGDPDTHDHFMRWLDCLNECPAIEPWIEKDTP